MGQASPAPLVSFLLVEAAGIEDRHRAETSVTLPASALRGRIIHALFLPELSPCKLGTDPTFLGHSLLVPHALHIFLRWGLDMAPWEASEFGS